MIRSTDRFLTTHTGSLPRPDDLIRMMYAKEEGVPVDPVALGARVRAAVAEIVKKQADAGIDLINDGELSKPSYATYVKDRLAGFGGTGNTFVYQDLADFPKLQQKVFGDPGRSRRKTPACNAPISVRDPQAALTDVGFPTCDDYHAPGATGISRWALTMRDRRRVSTNDAYLDSARPRPNLVVRGDALVDRVSFAGRRAPFGATTPTARRSGRSISIAASSSADSCTRRCGRRFPARTNAERCTRGRMQESGSHETRSCSTSTFTRPAAISSRSPARARSPTASCGR